VILLPAVDLLGGKAVRLYQGDYDKATVFDGDPMGPVRRFEEAGAEWLHLVDLDGARSGRPENAETVKIILRSTHLKVELGGGVRSMDDAARWLELGVSRVVLGTAAVTNAGLAGEAAARYGERIAVGADVKDGQIAVRGWTEGSGLDCLDFCRRMQDAGVSWLICTDVSRDGAMRGANLELYRTLRAALTAHLTASGGVSSLGDVRALAELGMDGAIIGKAYYTGAVDLRDAIAAGRKAVSE
jgi:phosphoribosylformimino-5-aminoimidazole carboxamide ribotide isomerase